MSEGRDERPLPPGGAAGAGAAGDDYDDLWSSEGSDYARSDDDGSKGGALNLSDRQYDEPDATVRDTAAMPEPDLHEALELLADDELEQLLQTTDAAAHQKIADTLAREQRHKIFESLLTSHDLLHKYLRLRKRAFTPEGPLHKDDIKCLIKNALQMAEFDDYCGHYREALVIFEDLMWAVENRL